MSSSPDNEARRLAALPEQGALQAKQAGSTNQFRNKPSLVTGNSEGRLATQPSTAGPAHAVSARSTYFLASAPGHYERQQSPSTAPVAGRHAVTRTLPDVSGRPVSPSDVTGIAAYNKAPQTHPLPALDNSNPPVSAPQARITRRLINESAPNSGQLSTTTPRGLTVISVGEKRQYKSARPPRARQRKPLVLVSTLVGLIVILSFVLFVVNPLDGQQTGQGIAQTLATILLGSTGAAPALNPNQHMLTPTPTPELLTSEGYCGGKSLWGTCAKAVTASGVMGTGQMQRPLNGAIITQVFGNPEYQLWCNCVRPHSGTDLATTLGTELMAADSGQVIWAGWDTTGLGWAVKIDHGHYIATVYGHMQRFIVNVGDNVTKGQVIGYEGSSGQSTGPHVHFMVVVNNIWVNPTSYVQLP